MGGKGVNQQTLTVKGYATVSLPPDTIDVTLKLTTRAKTYEQTLSEMNDQIQELATCLATVGFVKTEIKTKRMEASLDREQVKNEAGDYVWVVIGYVAECVQILSFDLEISRVSQVVTALKRCPAHPEFSLMYRLKDQGQLHTLLLEEAMKQAMAAAHILAQSAKVSLGRLLSIDYQGSPLNVGEYGRLLAAHDVSEKMEIYPEDIEASDEVTVVFEIIT